MAERVLGVGATCCGEGCELCAAPEVLVPTPLEEPKPARRRRDEEDGE